jgi:trimeric autotransporter adhesin
MSRMLVGSALLATALCVPAHVAAQTPNIISTIAGGGAPAGPAATVELISPSGLALDGAGNIYIGSSLGPQVLLLNSAGNVSVFAGTSFSALGANVGDGGPATSASFLQPIRVALDAAGNLYVADFGGGRIRKITPAGTITTVAGTGARCPSPTQTCGDGGPATQATFRSVETIAIDAAGNLFVSGNAERRVRRIDATTGIITTVAGNGNPCAVPTGGCGDGGPATSATLTGVRSLAFDPSGNLYIGDTDAGRIRRVDHTTQAITTYAGNGVPCLNNPPCGDNGPATSGNVNPQDITFDGAGNLFTVQGTTLREVDAATQTLTTLAGQGATAGFSGDGKPAVNATLNGAFAVRVDAAGNIYIADSGNSRIRRVDTTTGRIIRTIAGGSSGGSGGPATSATLGTPIGITVDASGNPYFADFATNFVRKININPSGNTIINIAGDGIALSSGDFNQATSARLVTNSNSSTPALDTGGNLYISDTLGDTVRKVDLVGGTIAPAVGNGIVCAAPTTPCGDGAIALQANLNGPSSVAVDGKGGILVADGNDFRVRRVDPASGAIAAFAGTGNICTAPTTPCGDGGPALQATFSNAGFMGLAVDNANNVFIADAGAVRVRRVDALTGNISTVAGNGTTCGNPTTACGDGGPATAANLNGPAAVAVDAQGDLFIADVFKIRRVDGVDGTIATIAGNGAVGYAGDAGLAPAASIGFAQGVAIDANENLYLSDQLGNRIRTVHLAPTQTVTGTFGNFASQVVNTTSAPQSVTLGNAGLDSLVIASVVSSDTTNFTTSNNCPGSRVAPGQTCAIRLTFTPVTVGPLPTTVTITTNDATNPVTVFNLQGTGAAAAQPIASPNPPTVAFAGEPVGTTSSIANVTLTNTGGANLVLSATPLALVGTNPADFAIVNTSTCTANLSMAPNATCIAQVTFKPTAAGARAATLTFTDDSGGVAGSVQSVGLTGTGNPAPPLASLDQTTLVFPSTTVNLQNLTGQTVTVSNSGGSNLVFGATPVTFTGPNAADYSFIPNGTSCTAGLSLAPISSQCVILVVFTPHAIGPSTGTMVITDNSGGTPGTTQTVALSGTGVAAIPPLATLIPAALTFATQPLNDPSVTQSITVKNNGQANLILGAAPFSITGANAAEFTSTTATTCTANLVIASNNACVVNITFTPIASGARTATLTINDNSGGSTSQQTAMLSGTGAGGTGGGITFQPSSLTFASTPLAHVIVQETGGADPNTLGFTGAFGGTAPGSSSGGTWNIAAGPWNTNYDIYELTAANQADLAAAGGYTYTATYKNLSTNTSPTFPGAPFSYGSYANFSVKGIRFDLGMHSDGQGNQVLALDPFDANSPVFTIPDLGTNPVTLTLLYNNTTQLGDAYVNGVKVITGYAGNSTAFTGENVVFGGEQANFSNVELIAGLPTAAATASVTLTNSSTAPLNFTAPAAISGPNAGDFTFAPGSTCAVGTAVPANGSCLLNLVFSPTAAGTRTATLIFSDDATPGTQTVSLNGTGAASNAPAVTLSPSSVGFPATSLNSTAAPITVTLTNSGNAPLNLGSFGIDDSQNAGDFAISTKSTCGPQSIIAAGNSCTIILTFTPSALGERTATLSISDDAAPGTQSIPLSGTGVGAGDFTITSPGTTIVLTNGQTAKFPITISPAPGSTIQVTFFAPGPVPTGTCVFYPQPNPATVTSAQTFNFLFTTNAPQPGLVAPLGTRPKSPFGPLTIRTLLAQMAIALTLLLLFWWQKFRARGFFLPRYAVLIPMLVIAAVSLTFVGCGGGGSSAPSGGNVSTPAPRGITVPGTYQIVISASSGTATRSTTVTVQIN